MPKKKAEMKTEREAKELSQEILGIVQAENNWYPLGQKIIVAIEGSVSEALGYKSVGEWMKECIRCSRAKAMRAVRAVRYLTAVTPDIAALMSEGNARLLTRLKPEDANREDWIQSALALSRKELGIMVARHRHTAYGFPKPEKWSNPFPKVPESGLELVDAAKEQLFRAYGADPETEPEKWPVILLAYMNSAMLASVEDLTTWMAGAEEEVEK